MNNSFKTHFSTIWRALRTGKSSLSKLFVFAVLMASLLGLAIFYINMPISDAATLTIAQRTSGKILLQVESHGEAWYVNPTDLKRYFLGRPADAFTLMRQLGLGITNANLAKIPVNTSSAQGDLSLRQRLSGRILLQVESHGEAWYVFPGNLKRYYLGRPSDAFAVMRTLSLGITNANLAKISTNTSFVSSKNLQTMPPSSPLPTPTPTPTPAPNPTPNNEIQFNAFVTGYSYWDNTPPGSSTIALPVIHNKAGGTGTYADPITIAVGHSITNGKDTPDFPKGTLFYMPYLQRYFIVEDTCGDGPTPQNGPCHTGYQKESNATAWLDIWIDGQNGSESATTNCMNNLTGVHVIIRNPASHYKVTAGSVYNNGCSQKYGETPITL